MLDLSVDVLHSATSKNDVCGVSASLFHRETQLTLTIQKVSLVQRMLSRAVLASWVRDQGPTACLSTSTHPA